MRCLLIIGIASASLHAVAHEPVARCVLLDAQTVRCRGANNDGDEMPGARMDVIALSGETLLEGRLDARSTLTFKRPEQPFYVLFDIAPGLQSVVEQEEIMLPPTRRARWMQ
ncbi:hypothetical protein G7047_11985 [Diaphorobacter sp. HDW4A]|nr:hypothetical protein G7047_11985 [Diaphorobacter sp. HDW4A]